MQPPLDTTASPVLEPWERIFVARLFAYGLALRAAIAILLHVTGYSARLAPDEGTYAAHSWVLALYWSGELLTEPERFRVAREPQGYYYLNAALFYVFGNTTLPMKLINCLVGASIARYMYRIAREFFGTAVARRAANLVTYFPSLILWSVLNIRDIWVIFLIVYISWLSLEIIRGYSFTGLAKLTLAFLALSTFRDYLFYIVTLPPVVAFLIGRRGHFTRNILLATAGGFAVIMLLQQGAMGDRTRGRMSLEAMAQVRQNMAIGGSAFAANADLSSPGAALAFLPVGLTYFFFSPFPWQVTSVLKALALPEMLLVYGLTPAIIRGIRYTLRWHFRDAFQVLMLTGFLTVFNALSEGNVGTLYRHRAQAISFYLMFAALGVEIAKKKTKAPDVTPWAIPAPPPPA